jgi:EAL domain-containing protein (putative c-di-GMP-specific phosphodiesterase class I)
MWDVDPPRLELEITESAIMANPEHALEGLTRLSEMGVRLSIDDFGTGYSSLAYVKRFPVDEIKIDRTFVIDMAVNENDSAIVRSIIDLAHNLGMSVVAEGVENRETWDLLAELGCDLAQGFYVSRAVPEAALTQWLDRRRTERTVVGAIPSLRASGRS